MSKNFEQLIEFVINDEEDKARELFHDIVVAKSRQIYEEMMEAEEVAEAEEDDEEEVTEAAEEDDEEEVTEAEEEDVEESFGGDSADDLIDDVEMEEEGMSMEGEGDEGGSDVENKLMDIEDKLDELMSEFEALMNDGDLGGDDMDDDMGMDDMGDEETLDVEIDGEDGMGDEEEVEFDDEEEGMMEAISLKAAPKPVTSEEGNTNKKSPTAFNSGATGMAGKPVHTGASMGGKHDSAAYKNTTKDLISDVQNAPARSSVKLSPATKPHLAQATGVNTKSPVGKA